MRLSNSKALRRRVQRRSAMGAPAGQIDHGMQLDITQLF